MDRTPTTGPVPPRPTRPHGLARACLVLLAIASLLMGLVMTGLGAWLVYLGGSVYYLVAGVVITVAAAAILAGREGAGVWLFALIVVATLAWSLAEIHAKGWMPAWGFDLAGRVGVLFGLLVLMVFALAFLRRRRSGAAPPERSQLVSLGVALVVVAGAALSASLLVGGVAAQGAAGPARAMAYDDPTPAGTGGGGMDQRLGRAGVMREAEDRIAHGGSDLGQRRSRVEERHMLGRTPIDALMCRIQFRQMHNEGIHAPPAGVTHPTWLSMLGVPCMALPWSHLSATHLRRGDLLWAQPPDLLLRFPPSAPA